MQTNCVRHVVVYRETEAMPEYRQRRPSTPVLRSSATTECLEQGQRRQQQRQLEMMWKERHKTKKGTRDRKWGVPTRESRERDVFGSEEVWMDIWQLTRRQGIMEIRIARRVYGVSCRKCCICWYRRPVCRTTDSDRGCRGPEPTWFVTVPFWFPRESIGNSG